MIRYYAGVEGSGKTCMMTRDLYLHYHSGGRVLAFPGYELYGNTKKQVLSELILPEQIISLLDSEQTSEIRQQRIAIALDEIDSYINHHNWWNKICDIMAGIQRQRRKLGLALLFSGPIFETLPPDIKYLVHEVVTCWDAHSFNRAIPRGIICKYTKEDKRGMLSNPRFRFSFRRKFYMKLWYRHYDTFAPVSLLNQFLKIKIQGREVVVGPDGKILNTNTELDPSKFDGIIGKYQPVEDSRYSKVREVVNYLVSKGVEEAPPNLLSEMLEVPHLIGRNGYGAILKSLGISLNESKRVYKLTEIN